MSVKRYQPAPFNERVLHATEDGEYIKYEDYAALEQRLIESERYGRQTDITIDNLEMKLAQMAAENAGLKSKGRELLSESCAVYAKLNKLIDPAIGDFADGQTLHEFQFVLDCETPATDAYMRERSE